jgi:hypothetical protein
MNANCFKLNVTRTNWMFLAALAVAGILSPARSQAALLFGNLNMTGQVNVSLDRIDFVGSIMANSATGDFAAAPGLIPSSGTILNIDNPPYATGVTVITNNWLTFPAIPNISFTLQVLLPGVQGSAACGAPVAAGQNCTPNVPNISPFNLSNTTLTTSTASFTVTGVEHDSITNTTTPFVAVITSPFDVPYQSLLATVNSGGTINTTFAATLTAAPIPEPASAITLLGGVLFLGIALFLRKRIQAQG